MGILYVYPETDGKDFYVGFWHDADDAEAEETLTNQKKPIVEHFKAVYGIIQEKEIDKYSQLRAHVKALSAALVEPFAALYRQATELRVVLPEDLVDCAFDLLELDGRPLFLHCPVSYVLDDEVPAFDEAVQLTKGLIVADLTADPEKACEELHRLLPQTRYVEVAAATTALIRDLGKTDLLLLSAHGSIESDFFGEIEINNESLTSDELGEIETKLVYFDSCEMGINWDFVQTFYDEGSTRYYLAPITSNDAGDSSTLTMRWFFEGVRQHGRPARALFETRRRLAAHYAQAGLDPVTVLNKAFPFRLYVFDNT